MKTILNRSFLFLISIVFVLSLQSCDDLNTSGSSSSSDTEATSADNSPSGDDNSTATDTNKKHSEMTPQEHSEFVAKHADHLIGTDKKMIDIKNAHIDHKDQFSYKIGEEDISLERIYNDAKEVNLMTITRCKGDDCHTKNYFFENKKLIYVFHHHEVKSGDSFTVDDHKTYFQDGQMLKCLEKEFNYKNGEPQPNEPYRLVDCNEGNKITKNMQKLLTSNEDDTKG